MRQEFQDIIRNEGIVRNEPAMLITPENETGHGRLILTATRIFFAKNISGTTVGNGDPLDELQIEPMIDIDLDTINTISKGNYLVDDNILTINYLQYQTVRFSVLDYEAWERDIETARRIPDIPGDPNQKEEAD